MKQHSRIIPAIIILAVIGLVASYTLGPKKANAPQNPDNSAKPATGTTPPESGAVAAQIVSIKENASSSPTVTVEYPQFAALPAAFNAIIADSVNSRLADFRDTVAENEAARKATATHGDASIPLSAYSFIASWEPIQVNEHYVSLVMHYYSYSGGANGDQELETYNYDVVARKPITLDDIFAGRDYLPQIAALVRPILTTAMDKASDGNAPVDMIKAGTEAVADNFANFTFTDSTVTFYFPKYSVAPGSFGEQKAAISRDAVK